MGTVTLQGAEGILVEGRHPLSVVFHGLEKPLKLSFVADNSICEALNQSWRRPSRRHRWSLWGHARSLWTFCIRYHPPMHWRVVATRIGVQLQQLKQQPTGIGDEVGQPRLAFETQLSVLGLGCLRLGEELCCQSSACRWSLSAAPNARLSTTVSGRR